MRWFSCECERVPFEDTDAVVPPAGDVSVGPEVLSSSDSGTTSLLLFNRLVEASADRCSGNNVANEGRSTRSACLSFDGLVVCGFASAVFVSTAARIAAKESCALDCEGWSSDSVSEIIITSLGGREARSP